MSFKNDNQKFTFFPNIIFPEMGPMSLDTISDIIKKFRIQPKNICQIGAANSGEFEFMEFIKLGTKATLIEPHPKFYEELFNKWGAVSGIEILNLGIWKESGNFKFYEKWAGTFISELEQSPVEKTDHYKRDEKNAFFCKCVRFSEIDKGDFDIVLIDTEGCEWIIIKEMRSRPLVLCVELYNCYHGWMNPDVEQIKRWMEKNNYISIAINESDVVYMRLDFFYTAKSSKIFP